MTVERTSRILLTNRQKQPGTGTMANEQLLFSEVRRGVLEPLEVEMPGKGCACSVSVNTGRNVGAWMEIYSDSLTKAGEQQRDEEPLHSVVVAAGRH